MSYGSKVCRDEKPQEYDYLLSLVHQFIHRIYFIDFRHFQFQKLHTNDE